MHEPSVDVDYEYCDDERYYAVRLVTDACEIGVQIPNADIGRLRQVASTPWLGGALRIGESAGAPAFWCVGDDDDTKNVVSILIGQDDQTWDIAFRMPVGVLGEILRSVAARDAEEE